MVVRIRGLVRIVAAGLMFAGVGCSSSEERVSGSASDAAQTTGELVFEGCGELSEARLRSDLAADIERLHERGFRKADLDDLAFEVERLYRSEGYHFAEVEYEYAPSRGVIRIQEGQRVFIDTVEFVGNRSIPGSRLDDLIVSRKTLLGFGERIYVEREARELRDAVTAEYLERGFRDVVVSDPETRFNPSRTDVTLTVKISEGPQYVLESIDFSRAPLLDRDRLETRFAYLRGSAYVPRLRIEIRTGVQELYAAIGHPFASVTTVLGDTPESSPERVALTLRVEAQPNAAVRVRRIEVRGNEETDIGFVRGRLLVKDGEIYDGAKVRASFNRLFATGLFKTVDLRLSDPVDTMEDEGEVRDLIVEVAEAPSLEYFFEAGFGSYDLARGKAGVRERNLFGRGLVGRAELLGSVRGGQATVGITDPWFLNSEWAVDLPVTALYREEPSFNIKELKTGLRVSRPIFEHVVVGVAQRFSLSDVSNVDVSDPRDEKANDLVIGAAGPFFEYDSRDDIFAPTRGVRARVFGEIGSPYLGGELTFAHGGIDGSAFLSILPGTVIAARGQTEWIFPLRRADSIPIQERLFNGGENSVRSFKESELGPKDSRGKPSGGEVRNLVSVELRQRIWNQLSGATFFDYGNVAIDHEKPFEDFRPGVGVGVRYGLPIGPVRLDFGYNPDKRDDEDLWVIHFAVGMAY